MDLLILVIAASFNLLLAIIVFARDVHKSYAQVFALLGLFLTIWIVANFMTNHYVDDLAITNFANKLTYVSGYATAIAGLFFTYLFPVTRAISRREKITVAFLVVVPLAASFTDAVAGIASLDKGTLVFSIGSLLWFYGLCFLLVLGLIAKNLFSVPTQGNLLRKKQVFLVLLAFILCALSGLLFNVLLPVVTGDWAWTKFGPLDTIFLAGIIGYTIVRHGLFDIRLAVMRGIAYFLSLATLAALYYVLAYAISEIVFQNNSVALLSQNPLSVFLALLLAFIFQPVKSFFDKLTSRIFYRDEYDTDEFFARLSRELSETTDLKTMLQHAAREIGGTMKAEYAYFFVRYSNNRHMSVGVEHHDHIKAGELTKLDDRVLFTKGIILTDILDETDSLRHLLAEHKIAIVLPLQQTDLMLGYLFLGYQKGRSYTKRDIRTLETISDELVIAIQNALSVQEVKEINETLQQRIQEATQELRTTNSQLQRLDEAKDEFVSMASHQLRTPLTSVKGYISMVLEEDAGKITPTQRQLLGEAFASSERMVRLINDFLNVSRLQTGKFILEKRVNNLAKIVSQEVESLQTTAQMHDLKLRFKKPPYFPLLEIDEAKIRQVIMNFIDNAIYYSHEGTAIKLALSVEDGQAVLRVQDTGIGVPKSEQPHLFSKFFRATNARKQRPDGTGVGLFLAKKVVDAHGGSMMVESEENKGSTFGFRLPVKKLTPKHADDSKKLKD